MRAWLLGGLLALALSETAMAENLLLVSADDVHASLLDVGSIKQHDTDTESWTILVMLKPLVGAGERVDYVRTAQVVDCAAHTMAHTFAIAYTLPDNALNSGPPDDIKPHTIAPDSNSALTKTAVCDSASRKPGAVVQMSVPDAVMKLRRQAGQ